MLSTRQITWETKEFLKFLSNPFKTTCGSIDIGIRMPCVGYPIGIRLTKNTIFQNINNIKNIITYKFIEKMWCEKYLDVKRKLRYYKEVINPNLDDKKYLNFN